MSFIWQSRNASINTHTYLHIRTHTTVLLMKFSNWKIRNFLMHRSLDLHYKICNPSHISDEAQCHHINDIRYVLKCLLRFEDTFSGNFPHKFSFTHDAAALSLQLEELL